jgi:hypothetical protein
MDADSQMRAIAAVPAACFCTTCMAACDRLLHGTGQDGQDPRALLPRTPPRRDSPLDSSANPPTTVKFWETVICRHSRDAVFSLLGCSPKNRSPWRCPLVWEAVDAVALCTASPPEEQEISTHLFFFFALLFLSVAGGRTLGEPNLGAGTWETRQPCPCFCHGTWTRVASTATLWPMSERERRMSPVRLVKGKAPLGHFCLFRLSFTALVADPATMPEDHSPPGPHPPLWLTARCPLAG